MIEYLAILLLAFAFGAPICVLFFHHFFKKYYRRF